MKLSNSLIAIDLGSNSFHMVMATEQAGCIQVLHTQKQRVSLGAGLNENGVLSEEAMQRGLDCLESFARSFARGCERTVRVVATHTLRKAVNSEEFIERAFRVFPYPIEVIEGRTEAELIYQGVVHTFALRGKTFVMDIGGGSTEFIIGSGFDAQWVESLEIGAGSLYRRCFANGTIDQASFDEARKIVADLLSPHVDALVEHGWLDAVGTSGSIKMVANTMGELFEDKTITPERLAKLTEILIEAGHYNDVDIAAVDGRRITQLAGVVALLSEVFEQLNIKTMEFCSGSLREGVLYNLSESTQLFDPRHRTITNLANLHMVDDVFSRRVVQQLEWFFDRLDSHNWFLTPVERVILTRAALLHEVGLTINFKKRQAHGAYIIENSVMPGFDVAEQQLISTLVRNFRGKIQPLPEDLSIKPNRFGPMIQLMRLAVIFTRGRADDPPWEIDIYFELPAMVLEIDSDVMQEQSLMDALHGEVLAQEKAGLELKLVIKP